MCWRKGAAIADVASVGPGRREIARVSVVGEAVECERWRGSGVRAVVRFA